MDEPLEKHPELKDIDMRLTQGALNARELTNMLEEFCYQNPEVIQEALTEDEKRRLVSRNDLEKAAQIEIAKKVVTHVLRHLGKNEMISDAQSIAADNADVIIKSIIDVL